MNRSKQTGFCKVRAEVRIARAAPHLWEEPCISGTDGKGTGAVFFSGCTLGCVFCQNHEISHDANGFDISVNRLAEIFSDLEKSGVHSLDLVTGTQFVPSVIEALRIAKPHIPVVWNSGGYEKTETLRMLEGFVQVYLPDLKHFSPRLSGLCTGRPDYFEKAAAALREMRRQTGENLYSEDGILQRGMIVRHLLLPNCTTDAIRVIRFMREELPGVPLSLMRQYTPQESCTIPGLQRRITDREYGQVLEAMQSLGVPGYFQDADSADAGFTPDFDGTGVAPLYTSDNA